MLLALLLPALVVGKVVEKEDLLLVDDIGLLDTINENRVVLTEFYAPWCGHCKKIAPEFEKAAKRLKADGIKTVIIDGSTQRHTAVTYGVLGYPSIYAMIDRKAIMYTGEAKADNLVKWVREKAGQQSKEIFTIGEIDTLLKKKSPIVLLFAGQNSAEKTIYEDIIRPLNGTFLITESKEVEEHYAVTSPRLVILKRSDDQRVDYEGEFTPSAVSEFIERNSIPWLLPFSSKTSKQVFFPNSTRLFFFRLETEVDKYKEVVEGLVKSTKGKPTIVVADLTADLNERLAELLGVNPRAQPFLMLYSTFPPRPLKYIYSGEKTLEGIESFLSSYRSGTLSPYFKTEDPPKESIESGVHVLVGKTFPEVSQAAGKTVLVHFYAPWCEHCFELSIEYEKVARHFRGRDNVIIAKIDAMMNELEDHPIATYPQLKLFRSHNKTALLYDGERKAADIISFVETHLGKK